MRLKELQIKNSYINQGSDNLLDNLIKPALECSILYRRSVGFFSSSVFSIITSVLKKFIKNGGKVQLIVSPNLNSDDILAIKEAYESRENIISNIFLKEFEEELFKFDDECLNILYNLITNEILDIKVATLKKSPGMYHDKLGIITDKYGDSVVFYGSPNESVYGYQNNYEKVRVVKSWKEADENAITDEISEFETLWFDRNPFVKTYNFMESIKKSIIRVMDNRSSQKGEKAPIKLRDYQVEAINAWVKNGYKGFYVMATGTGKTWTAIFSAKKLLEKTKSIIVIAAPYKHLVKQWSQDVEKVFHNASIILVSSENPNWYSESSQAIISQKYNNEKQVILITTIKSFLSARFEHIISISEQEKLLIVDEAHRFTNRSEELKKVYNYMLGLSATPINGKNNEEGNQLVKFFGGQVFNLPIEIALKKGYLVDYNYIPIFVSATDEEEERFNNLSIQILSCYSNGKLVDKEKLVRTVRSRLRVIAMAEEKSSHIDYLLDKVEIKDHFVVYCGDGRLFDNNNDEVRHIQFVKNQLDKMGIKSSQFTASEDIKRRMELVDMFERNEISSLVAIRCLDEGINIPSIKSALILSSNDDYREFVQRRGRILRKYDDKKFANIYDVVVLPTSESRNMAKIELRRFYEYARLALNKDEMLEELDALLIKYDLEIIDVMLYTEVEVEDELDE